MGQKFSKHKNYNQQKKTEQLRIQTNAYRFLTEMRDRRLCFRLLGILFVLSQHLQVLRPKIKATDQL